MGEVYRAEDLKLGESVALKFLPAELSLDGAALARFHREVRVARQIAHCNVCRVFDIGEAGGLHFLSMEYIDGEDLSGLLKRIGRLPRDKAVELARQICAGLGAAHEAGVLHRDMKPANVMVDGKGRAKITDFGLARVADELKDQAAFAGTPAYMAPEQITAGEVSIKTDLYALGLVLYEMFTGEKAFRNEDWRVLMERGGHGELNRPSSHVEGLDPVVEAVILRCLEDDPADRPSAALEVSAALPGGDPLAAALAAGETPSPEMVAAAPQKGLLKPAAAAGLLGALVLFVAAGVWARQKISTQALAHLPKSPEVLEDRARTLLRDLGHGEELVAGVWGWRINEEYIEHLRHRGTAKDVARSKDNRPPLYWFWYSPEPLRSRGWRAGLDDPAYGIPGMTSVVLDPEGRLARLRVVPPNRDQANEDSAPDWSRLFAAAGLDSEELSPAELRWTPPVYAHGRQAWDGFYPAQADAGRPAIPIHVEAAHHRGVPVLFDVLATWDRPVREVPAATSHRPVMITLGIIFGAAFTGGLWLVRRHLRDGRGDRRGANRLGLFMICCQLVSWVLGGRHVAELAEITFFVDAAGVALFWAAFYWILYIAFEPFLRRHWPEAIIGWSRLLAGNLQDPLVGKEALIGSLLGAVCAANGFLIGEVLRRSGEMMLFADQNWPPFLSGARSTLGALFGFHLTWTLVMGFGGTFVFVLLYILLRRKWLATALTWIAWALLMKAAFDIIFPGLPLFHPFLLAGLMALATARFGVLTLVVCLFNFYLLLNIPTTTDLSSWHAESTVLAIGLTMALGAWSTWAAVGGRPLFRSGSTGREGAW